MKKNTRCIVLLCSKFVRQNGIKVHHRDEKSHCLHYKQKSGNKGNCFLIPKQLKMVDFCTFCVYNKGNKFQIMK